MTYQEKLKRILEARGSSLRAFCLAVVIPYNTAYQLLKTGIEPRSNRNKAIIDREFRRIENETV